MDRAEHRGVGRLYRASGARRRPGPRRATARSRSSFATIPATPTSSCATSDATWEAYNDYGGNSLYTCTVACPPGNPLALQGGVRGVLQPAVRRRVRRRRRRTSYLFYAEYQMIRLLEEQRLRRQLRRATSDLDRDPVAAAQPQALRLQRARRVLVRQRARERAGGAQRRRQPRVLQRQRDVLEDAWADQQRRIEHAVPDARSPIRRRTSTRPSIPMIHRRGRARGAIPASVRRATAATRERLDRSVCSSSTPAPRTSRSPRSTASCGSGGTPRSRTSQPGQT